MRKMGSTPLPIQPQGGLKMKKIIISLGLAAVLVLATAGCSLFGNSDDDGPGTGYENPAVISGDEQTVTTSFLSDSYTPITVQRGIPVRWTILITEENLNSCNNEILIPKYDIDKKLTVGENIVEFTPTETGTFPYSCWMGMIYSRITVVENLSVGGSSNPSNSGNSNSTSGIIITPRTVTVATVEGGRATVELSIGAEGFGVGYSTDVVIVQKNLVTDFVFTIRTRSCASDVLFPQLAKSVDLTANNTVTITPVEDFTVECSMQMYGFIVVVVDDINGTEVERLIKDIEDNPSTYTYFSNADCDDDSCC